MSHEQKNKLVEYCEKWINKQSEDKKNEMKKKGKRIFKKQISQLSYCCKVKQYALGMIPHTTYQDPQMLMCLFACYCAYCYYNFDNKYKHKKAHKQI